MYRPVGDGGTTSVVAGGRGGSVAFTSEERVLQCIVRFCTRLGVIVQHAEDQVLEFPIVGRGVAHFPVPDPPRTTCLNTKNVIQGPAARPTIVVL